MYVVHKKYAKACAVIFSVKTSLKDSQSQFSDVKMLRGFKCFELTTLKTFVKQCSNEQDVLSMFLCSLFKKYTKF